MLGSVIVTVDSLEVLLRSLLSRGLAKGFLQERVASQIKLTNPRTITSWKTSSQPDLQLFRTHSVHLWVVELKTRIRCTICGPYHSRQEKESVWH